ncbi:MAG TPA: hypothetical protein VLK65_05615 [Vicinamibacteria bacterium]|nr:hypothetical protein [Vicinamibacteria bacterium]
MPLRLVQVSVRRSKEEDVLETIHTELVAGSWSNPLDGDRTLVTALVEAKECEGISTDWESASQTRTTGSSSSGRSDAPARARNRGAFHGCAGSGQARSDQPRRVL